MKTKEINTTRAATNQDIDRIAMRIFEKTNSRPENPSDIYFTRLGAFICGFQEGKKHSQKIISQKLFF